MKAVAVARLASYFLLLVQKKVTKQKDTPYRLFPALLSLLGGKLKLASLKQSLADNSHQACAARRGSRGELVGRICLRNPPYEIISFGAIRVFNAAIQLL